MTTTSRLQFVLTQKSKSLVRAAMTCTGHGQTAVLGDSVAIQLHCDKLQVEPVESRKSYQH